MCTTFLSSLSPTLHFCLFPAVIVLTTFYCSILIWYEYPFLMYINISNKNVFLLTFYRWGFFIVGWWGLMLLLSAPCTELSHLFWKTVDKNSYVYSLKNGHQVKWGGYTAWNQFRGWQAFRNRKVFACWNFFWKYLKANSIEFNDNSGHSKYISSYEWMVQVWFLEDAGKTERYDNFILWNVVLYRNICYLILMGLKCMTFLKKKV
jgi:hypothetical protein